MRSSSTVCAKPVRDAMPIKMIAAFNVLNMAFIILVVILVLFISSSDLPVEECFLLILRLPGHRCSDGCNDAREDLFCFLLEQVCILFQAVHACLHQFQIIVALLLEILSKVDEQILNVFLLFG